MKQQIEIVSKDIGYAMMEKDLEATAGYIEDARAKIQVLQDGMVFLKENFDGDLSLIGAYDSVMSSVREEREQVLSREI